MKLHSWTIAFLSAVKCAEFASEIVNEKENDNSVVNLSELLKWNVSDSSAGFNSNSDSDSDFDSETLKPKSNSPANTVPLIIPDTRPPLVYFSGIENWNLLLRLYQNPTIMVNSLELSFDIFRTANPRIRFGLNLTKNEFKYLRYFKSEKVIFGALIEDIKANFFQKTGQTLVLLVIDGNFWSYRRLFQEYDLELFTSPEFGKHSRSCKITRIDTYDSKLMSSFAQSTKFKKFKFVQEHRVRRMYNSDSESSNSSTSSDNQNIPGFEVDNDNGSSTSSSSSSSFSS